MSTQNTKFRILIVAFAALALCLGSGWAVAEDGDEKKVRRIEIHPEHDCEGESCDKRVHRIEIRTDSDCEGDDCEEGEHHAIFIGDDGEHRVLKGSEAMAWVGGDGEHGFFSMDDLHEGGFLGVQLTDLTDELKTHFGVPEGAGVLVAKVVDDSPAQHAGLEVGDIVTLVDGEEVGSGRSLSSEIGSRDEGETVTLEIWRDGRAQQVSAVLAKREGHPMMRVMPRIKMMRGGGGDRGVHIERIIDCEGDDCEGGFEDFDCGSDECRVEVRCESEGDCSCTVNGDDVDCSEIPGFHGH